MQIWAVSRPITIPYFMPFFKFTQIMKKSLFLIPIYYFTNSNFNHTCVYVCSKGKIMIHLTLDYQSDKDCRTPSEYLRYYRTFQGTADNPKKNTSISDWDFISVVYFAKNTADH